MISPLDSSLVSFVVPFCASGANGVDDDIVLMGKDRAQIEFETSVTDITNDGRNGMAKGSPKVLD